MRPKAAVLDATNVGSALSNTLIRLSLDVVSFLAALCPITVTFSLLADDRPLGDVPQI